MHTGTGIRQADSIVVTTFPADVVQDLQDFILWQPDATEIGVEAIYVMVSKPYGETNARGKYSGREYNTNKAGGPIQNLDWKGASIDRAGVDKVKLHTGRFTESDANKVMIGRLEKILKENCLPPILTGDFIHMRSGNWSVIAIWVLEMARCQIIKGSVE